VKGIWTLDTSSMDSVYSLKAMDSW